MSGGRAAGRGASLALTQALIEASFPRTVADGGPSPPMLSEPQIMEWLETTFAGWDHGRQDVWLFAYGSLIWQPEFEFAERRVGLVRGFHRRFCLWQWRFRGTREAPNLMLALDAGGSCRGVAYRIAAPDAKGKLAGVWRREMLGDGYRPRWLSVWTEEGPVEAVSFVAHRAGERYAGRLSEDLVADRIASACGHRGPSAEYLLRTVMSLEEMGMRDHALWRLQEIVAERLIARSGDEG